MATAAHTRPTGLTERAVLKYLSGGEFRGSAFTLSQRTKTRLHHVWTAIAGLAADELIDAHKALDGQLTLRITHKGRQLKDRLDPRWTPGRFSR